MRKRKQNSDSRAAIIEAATDEFARHGFEGARVDRIAKGAGINKAMIYYYFSSKQKLYREIIDVETARLVDALNARIADSDDLETVLLSLSQYYPSVFGSNSRFGPIFIRELVSGGKAVWPSLEKAASSKGLTAKLKRLLDAGKRQGKVRKLDSRQALISFIGMNMFYLVFQPLVNTIWEIKDEEKFNKNRPREIVDLFMGGINAE